MRPEDNPHPPSLTMTAIKSELKPPRDHCALCDIPERNEIDNMLANGANRQTVLAWLAAHGYKRPSGKPWNGRSGSNLVSLHKVHHCAPLLAARTAVLRRDVKQQKLKTHLPPDADVAVIVAARGRERLLDPTDDLDVTVAEALRAQELLDKRRSGAADRDLVAALALLSSGVAVLSVTEGEYEEVDAERAEDEDWSRALASGQ